MLYKRLTVAVFLIACLSFVMAACGDTPTATPAPTTAAPTITAPTAVPTTAPPTTAPPTTARPTSAPATNTVAPTTARPTTAAATTATRTTSAATTPASNGVAGPGHELVGQLIAAGDTDVRVKNVARFTELKGFSKTATPKGVFLAVVMEVANLGKKPAVLSLINLNDAQGKEYGTTTDFDAIGALAGMAEFKSSLLINPGFVGTDVKLYDIPKDLTGLKIVDSGFQKTTRKPSPDSFAVSGGKGPDSGAGQELLGKTITEKVTKLEITVRKVERLNEIKAGGKTLKPQGAWILVVYDAKNNGDKPGGLTTFDLQDSEGRVYNSFGDFDIALALGSQYKTDLSINPGQSGSGYKVFEVIKEASGFSLVDAF